MSLLPAAFLTLMIMLLAYSFQGAYRHEPLHAAKTDLKLHIEEADVLFRSLRAQGRVAMEASREAATLLKAGDGVRHAEATGSDTVLVTLENGEKIVVMLGRRRR